VLTAAGLWFSYPDTPCVLKDIAFEVTPGQRVGLIGPNGAGKTTLFLIICGMLKPSANLDIRSRRRLIRLLQSSAETILVASHDLELVLEVCERVILIDEGKIVADGESQEIMGNEQLMEAHGQEKPHSLIPHQIPHH